jgi:DNA-binding MarR family transcriptional regulator
MTFQRDYGLCLNEGMLLCSLKSQKLTSGEIADALGLTCSNTSKVIKSVESKGYVKRTLGKGDKRQMYFSITKPGLEKLNEMMEEEMNVALILKDIRENYM